MQKRYWILWMAGCWLALNGYVQAAVNPPKDTTAQLVDVVAEVEEDESIPDLYPEKKDLKPEKEELRRELNLARGRLYSPYLSLANFLLTLQEQYYHPQLAIRSLNQQGLSEKEAIEVATRLKRVLDGRGIYILLDEIPKDSLYTDTTSRRHRYQLHRDYPDIYLERIGGQWVFPKRTQNALPELYADLFPYKIDRLLNLLPASFRYAGSFWGFTLWNLCSLGIIVGILLLVHKLLSLLLTWLVQYLLRSFHLGRFASNLIKPIARPLSIVLVLHLALQLVAAIEFSPERTRFLINLLDIAIPIYITVILYRIAGIISNRMKARAALTESKLDDQLVPIMTNILRTIVIIIGIMMVLYNLHIDLTALIAGLSIGGLALALASQDTVKNLLGSLLIFLDKPFQVGQAVRIGDVEGTVESVGMRATRIRTGHNSVIYMPNALISDKSIDNLGMRTFRRMQITIGLQYDTPPELLETYLNGLRALVLQHPHTRKDAFDIYLNNMSASSLDILFVIHFAVATAPEELRCRHEILMAIIRMAQQLGIQFAFPTQSIHVETLPGQPSTGTPYTLNAQTAREAVEKAVVAEASHWKQPPA
ncbi:MAG: mechanosensitive ion channel family protein [Bacteroidetes bacterium]|nr:mechanosensitive ion channel family protein [Bacteroidota bacterium]